MHMADALLSPAVGGAMCAVSAAAIGRSVKAVAKDELSEKKVPVMAVSGAFVFAAQMINFTIPGTGSSGHIGGGVLLASMLGGPPALLAISAVLIIQCLCFADGGLLALGCNIFNMGVVPCLIMYPLLFKPLAKKLSARAIATASVAAVVASMQLGAFGVVLETQLSGIAELPFGAFVLLMQPIHLAIGLVEGAVTAAVLCFVHKTSPEILPAANEKTSAGQFPAKRVVAMFAVLALLTGGLLSIFASSQPDGLEWSIEKITGATELGATGGVQSAAGEIQENFALMPGYDYKSADGGGSLTGAPVSGIVGVALTFALAGGAALLISLAKKNSRVKAG